MTATGDLFPESPRVIYLKAPLTEVICQLRFPQILRIESSPPADFQERIRDTFPILERLSVGIPAEGLPPEFAQVLLNAVGGRVAYSFRTEDQKNTLTLLPDALSLTTTDYRRWEGFRDLLIRPLQALIDIYKPSFFNRIGLRYQNAIKRKELGLAQHSWADLLKPEVLGALVLPQFETNVQEVRKTIRTRLPDGKGGVFAQHGFGGRQGRDRDVYLLDFDFYSDKTEVADAIPILDDFHTRAGRAFRWCITPTLHKRLEPEPQLDASAGRSGTPDRKRRARR